MTFRLAIVGAGPAGLYLADGLIRQADCHIEITVFEDLPTPFGLARYGVAGDHLGTKAVTRLLARVFRNDAVTYAGNVRIGDAISLECLKENFHAVAIATGVNEGRSGIPVDSPEIPVISAFDFIRWANGYPDMDFPLKAETCHRVGIVGNGNVALDVARILLRGESMYDSSDFPESRLATIGKMKTREVHLLGRRKAVDTRFSPKELDELLNLPETSIRVFGIGKEASPGTPENVILKAVNETANVEYSRSVTFHFECDPISVSHNIVNFGARSICVDVLVLAIGQSISSPFNLPLAGEGYIANESGQITGYKDLYVVGWAGGPPTGTIGTNRVSSHNVAKKILSARHDLLSKSLASNILEVLRKDGITPIGWADWLAIDDAECLAGQLRNRPREKFTTRLEMLRAVPKYSVD